MSLDPTITWLNINLPPSLRAERSNPAPRCPWIAASLRFSQ
jgi:hypothetical protein